MSAAGFEFYGLFVLHCVYVDDSVAGDHALRIILLEYGLYKIALLHIKTRWLLHTLYL